MISPISSFVSGYYSSLASNSAYNMMSISNARLGLLSSPMMHDMNSLGVLHAIDTQLEQQMLRNSLQYKMANAILEQQEEQKKKDAKKFNVFA